MERRNFSKKRAAVLEMIRSTKSHPSADWVYAQLKEAYPKLSLATVYRNIAEFKEAGEICSVAVVNGVDRVDGDTSQHQHFVCTHCGAVIDLELVLNEADINAQISAQGLRPERLGLTVYGECGRCLKSKK